jgi:hypothetical protein
MYPSARKNVDMVPLTEDERINHQMALLLMKNDAGPSPDAASATFRIDLPMGEEREHELMAHGDLGMPHYGQRPVQQRHIPIQVQHYYDAHQQIQQQAEQLQQMQQMQQIQQMQQMQQMQQAQQAQQTQQPQQPESVPLQQNIPPVHHSRSASINDRGTLASAWERGRSRGRSDANLTVSDAVTRGRSEGRSDTQRPRALSREERRREIEMGAMSPSPLPR